MIKMIYFLNPKQLMKKKPVKQVEKKNTKVFVPIMNLIGQPTLDI